MKLLKNKIKYIFGICLLAFTCLATSIEVSPLRVSATNTFSLSLKHQHEGYAGEHGIGEGTCYRDDPKKCPCNGCWCHAGNGISSASDCWDCGGRIGDNYECHGCGHSHYSHACPEPVYGGGYECEHTDHNYKRTCGADNNDLLRTYKITGGWEGEHYYITFTKTNSGSHDGSNWQFSSAFKGNTAEWAGPASAMNVTTSSTKIEIFANGNYTVTISCNDYYNGHNRSASGTLTVDDYGTVFSYDPNATNVTGTNIWNDAISTNPNWWDIGKTVVIPNKQVELKACPWTREGYTFVGWSVNPNVKADGLTGKTVYEDQKNSLNSLKNSANYSQPNGNGLTATQLKSYTGPSLLKGSTGEYTNNTGAWRGTHMVTLYAIWMPNEYYIYYDKGKTDDRSTTITLGKSIDNANASSFRTTNITARSARAVSGLTKPFEAFNYIIDYVNNSKIGQLPYTKTFFDHKVNYGNVSPVKGRSYELVFNPNFPDTNSEGGAATQEIKDSYSLNLQTTDSSQTIHENVDNNYKSKELYGYLFSANRWIISDYNTAIISSSGVIQRNHVHSGSEITGGGCYTVPVYHKHTGSSVTGGGCYTIPNAHVHTDGTTQRDASYHSPIAGGCFKEAVGKVHQHKDANGVVHDVTYISPTSSGCFNYINYALHKKHQHTDGVNVQDVNYHATRSGGCFTKAVYKVHQHKDANGVVRAANYQAPVSGGCFTTDNAVYPNGRKTGSVSYSSESWGDGSWTRRWTCSNCGVQLGWAGTVWDGPNTGGDNPHHEEYHDYEGPDIHYCSPISSSYTLSCGKVAGQRYADEGIDYYACGCGKTAGTRYSDEAIEYYTHEKTDPSSTFRGYGCGCGKQAGYRYLSDGVDYYICNCNTVEGTPLSYSLGCGKTENVSIDKWALGCGKTTSSIDTTVTNGLLNPPMSGSINRPNYENAEGQWCLATAEWKDTTITNFPEPTMYGYVFLGWYDSPNYTLTPNGDGTFKHTTTANKITLRTINPSRDSHAREDLYAHWMPKMAYLNYSYPSDDGTKNNYTNYTNGHVVNDLNNGNLTTAVHVGKYYWEYAGRSEAAAFFENAPKNYVPYANIPNPAVYFKVDLFPRTKVNSINLNSAASNYSVLMPNKFLNTVFKFTAPKDGNGVGTSKTLYDATVAAQNWNQKSGAGIVYGTGATGSGNTYGNTQGAQAEGSINKYTLYDVWTLAGWYTSNSAETSRDTLLTTGNAANATALVKLEDKKNLTPYDSKLSAQRLDLTTAWNKRNTDLKLPLPKRLLVFDLDSENGTILNLDSSDSMNNLRKLARGEAVAYSDGSGKDNVYQGKKILTDTSHCLVYDFTFENWINGKTGQTYGPLANVYADKDSEYYAKWNLNTDITLPQVEKAGYVFLGWYTVPQDIIPTTSATTNSAFDPTDTGHYNNPTNGSDYYTSDEQLRYYAGAGYNFVNGHLEPKDCTLQKTTCDINWDITTNKVTLYAWFNRTPIFVDMYEGLFFEGQDVSLQDLKKLVGVFDYEDDYSALALEYIESLPSVSMDSLYLPVVADDGIHDDDISNNFDVDKDYSVTDMLETLQVENYEFDSTRWEPVDSKEWETESDKWQKVNKEPTNAEYPELPNAAEEGSSKDIQNTNHPLYIRGGKLYSPRHPEGIDGVYRYIGDGENNGVVYYTDTAKEELAYYLNDPSNPEYQRMTGIKLKIKSITYKVTNNQLQDEVVTIDSNLATQNYDDKKAKEYEKSYYTKKAFVGRSKNKELHTYRESKHRLDTSSSRLMYTGTESEWSGNFVVTYVVTDNGILLNGALIANSPITITYERECKIKYNQHPIVYTTNLADLTSTTYTSYDEFENMILDSQVVLDAEDNRSNNPWWTRKKTTPKLQDTLEVVGVKNIQIDDTLVSKYAENLGNKTAEQVFKDINTDIANQKGNGLYVLYTQYKTSTDVVKNTEFKCISSFDIVVDAHDQWGKYASGKTLTTANPNPYAPRPDLPDPGDAPDWPYDVDGTDEVEKNPHGPSGTPDPNKPNDDEKPNKQDDKYCTISIILVNDEATLDLNDANIMKHVRFINENYLDSVSSKNSYWGEGNGRTVLESIMDKKEKGTGLTNSYVMPDDGIHYETPLGTQVDITIEDYSD